MDDQQYCRAAAAHSVCAEGALRARAQKALWVCAESALLVQFLRWEVFVGSCAPAMC